MSFAWEILPGNFSLGKPEFSFFISISCLGLSCSTWDLHCVTWDLLLWSMDSLVEAQASVVVALGLGCSAACWISVSQPVSEAEFPAFQGQFLHTEPPGKSLWHSCKGCDLTPSLLFQFCCSLSYCYFNVFFLPVLLRYNWHTALCKFKVDCIIKWLPQ